MNPLEEPPHSRIIRWLMVIILLVIICAVAFCLFRYEKGFDKNQKENTKTKLVYNLEKQNPLSLEEVKFPIGEYPKLEPPKEEIGVEISTSQNYNNVVQNPTTSVGVEQWRGLVQSYFGAETERALMIMTAESKGDPSIISPTSDYGLMQINQCHANMVGGDLNQLLIPEVNIRVAYQIWQDQNWYPWTTHGVLGL